MKCVSITLLKKKNQKSPERGQPRIQFGRYPTPVMYKENKRSGSICETQRPVAVTSVEINRPENCVT